MIGERKVGAAIAETFTHGDASVSSASVTRRIDVCVPSLWISHRSKCSIGPAFMTISGGWMMGPAFISAPDSASPHGSITPGESASDDMECMIGLIKRKHANRQPFGTDGDSDLERPVLARQPWQRTGLGERDSGAIAGSVRSLRKDHRAERRRRQEHHLAVT